MRSSIACARCRRSKVKCINNGVNTTCRACENSGRGCTYPIPAPGSNAGYARREQGLSSSAPGQGDGNSPSEIHRRPRPKKSAVHIASTGDSKESPRALIDALDPAVLTPKVLDELFQIFQLHFATDLPFLHPPSFRKCLYQFSTQSTPADPSSRQPSTAEFGSSLLLLSFVALTARFHDGLVSYHSLGNPSRPNGPVTASEYYAVAAKSRLFGSSGDFLRSPNLDRVQATLMLALHEWGMCRGYSAWILVGDAVRAAQALGLQFENDLDDMPLARSVALSAEARHLGINPDMKNPRIQRSDAFIDQEVKRRTFWSCFIMDRYMSSGKYRPQLLSTLELRIQLPSSEKAFLFGEKVRTELLSKEIDNTTGRSEIQRERRMSVIRGTNGYLTEPSPQNEPPSPTDSIGTKWEVGMNEGPLSRFIKALDLYGRIVKWSCAGGRRTEDHPPWDPRSTFHSLAQLLAMLKNSLPSDLTLSENNTEAHLALSSATPYTLMHTLYSLCSIMLHREYVPFIPMRCSKPEGPLDPPIFPPDQYRIPHGFWEESARECFKSARDMVDLLRTCQQHGKLVETPIIGFATYTAAFTGVYCINFPQMDPYGYLSKPKSSTDPVSRQERDTGGFEASREALRILGGMRPRLQMANGWFRTVNRVHRYYRKIKKDFAQNLRALENTSESNLSGDTSEHGRQLSLREGGVGGGLEEYKLLERILKEFGNIEDEEMDMRDGHDADSSRILVDHDNGSDAGSAIKSDSMDVQEDQLDNGASRTDKWNAINTSQSLSTHNAPPRSTPTPHGINTASPGYNLPLPPTFSPSYHPHADGQPHPQQRPQSSHSSPLKTEYHQQQQPPQPHHHPQNHPQQQQHPSAPYQTYPNQQQQPPPPRQHHTPTAAAAAAGIDVAQWNETRLHALDTRFGGDDVAAFVSGQEYADFANAEGWLGTIWGNAAQSVPAAAAYQFPQFNGTVA